MCTDVVNGYYCTCPSEDYQGVHCEIGGYIMILGCFNQGMYSEIRGSSVSVHCGN